MTKTAKSEDPTPGIVTEAEAAEETPAEIGEKAANARAAAHRKQGGTTSDSGVVSEAEVKRKYSPVKVEAAHNEQAARHRAEAHPTWAEPHVATEADVVAEVPDGDKLAEPKKRTTKNSKPRQTR